MPIKFISLNEKFCEYMRKNYFEVICDKIENYKPIRKTYYVSPSNSLCFMDGGIDLALSRIVFPNIEYLVKEKIKKLNVLTLLGRYYLPIGSSMIIEYDTQKSLVMSPTMLLPQDVSETNNAYYCTMAVLYNIIINKKENIDDIDILFTSLCCGYGKMDEMKSSDQIIKGINNFINYKPKIVKENLVLNEPNLEEQPKLYQNTEWFDIDYKDIKYI